MPPSARPTEAALRIQRWASQQAASGGWVPRQPDLPIEQASLASEAAVTASPEEAELAVTLAAVAEPEPGEAREPARATVGGLLRSARVDPGRRGVVALVAVGVVAAVIAGVVMMRSRPSQQPLSVPAVVGSTDATGSAEVVVDVAGKVRKPGLARLPAGSRVDDALKAAGGALPGASTGTLNLARKLTDGEQVLVGMSPPGGAAGGPAADGLVDLNTGTAEDFDGLPGIGPVLADHIVAWRTEHGRFASIDQLREVSGIGEAKYASIKAKVRV